MIQRMLRAITGKYHLEGMDLGAYRKMKVRGITFHTYAFRAEGLGHVSAMSASGFFGLMKMETLIINPTEVDLPLFSYDRVHAMGKDTLIVELYDTMAEKADLSVLDAVKGRAMVLPDHDLGQHWYDSIKLPQSISKRVKKAQSPVLDDVAMQYLKGFLTLADAADFCDEAGKCERVSVYVEGLLEHGGSSTDGFRKSLGQERTEELFRRFLFGTVK